MYMYANMYCIRVCVCVYSMYMNMYSIYVHAAVSEDIYTEKETNGKRQLLFACCKQTMQTANFCSFTAKGNGNGSLFSLVANDNRQSAIAVSANVPICVICTVTTCTVLYNIFLFFNHVKTSMNLVEHLYMYVLCTKKYICTIDLQASRRYRRIIPCSIFFNA